jgi:threonine dehydratase
MPVSFEDVLDARPRVHQIAQLTPVHQSRTFDRLTGLHAVFKCENFQRGGAFKIRGATNAILALPPEIRARGVVTFSSGNHAQAVAIAAAHAGIPAVIVMPADAPKSKLEATRGYGAEVVLFNRLKDDRVAMGNQIAAERGSTVIPPFDHPMTIAGQGTCALEFFEQTGPLDALVVCIGGGGLLAGSCIAAHAVRPHIKVFGVEPELANDTFLSLQQGRHVRIAPPETIADGLRSECPGQLTLPIIKDHVEEVLLVTEDEIRATMRFFLTRMKLVVEPSGAAAAAAVLHNKLPAGLGRVGIIISGGNVDLEFLATL